MSRSELVKTITNTRRSIVKQIRTVFPPFDVLWAWCMAKRSGNMIVKKRPVTVKTYCESRGEQYHVVEAEQKRCVYEPAFFECTEGTEHFYEAKEIYIAELHDVIVHGGTGFILAGDSALTDIVTNDSEGRVEYAFGLIRRGTKNRFYIEVKEDICEVDCAINLCGMAAFNYYHLTIEILSRYEYVRNYLSSSNVTVLLDEDARKYHQFRELVGIIIGNASITYVPPGQRVRCKKVICPSMNTWMPMNVRHKIDFRMSDNMIAKSAVENIREATKLYRKEKTDRKIFISRKNTSISRIQNELEVIELFKNAGYEIVCTEELSLQEQIEMFSTSTCIVGATGAALTNMIYCNPGAVFGCIIPRKYGFCIYSSIAHMVGCKILFLDAEVTKTGGAIYIEQYKVDLDTCQRYIRELNDLQLDIL